MSDEKPVSIYGDEVDPANKVSEAYWVPPEQRKDTDEDGSRVTDALTPNRRDRSVNEEQE